MYFTNISLLTGSANTLDKNINIAWVVIMAILIFLMQAGFAMIETGFTRAKSAGNIIMKNLMNYVICSLIFFLTGFAFMFGGDNPFIGSSGFFDATRAEGTSVTAAFNNLSPESFIFFQTVLCGITPTIVSGAMAERTKLIAYIIFSAAISFIIYPVAGHWIWNSKGWLAELGFHDFAGSTVIHSLGGWCALAGAKLVGARVGKYTKEGKIYAIPGHNIVIGALGVFILWFAWFGVNCGSTLSIDYGIGKIVLVTNLSACASAFLVAIITWIRYSKPDITMTLNGALGGLVAITAGCDVVNSFGAIIIGAAAGCTLVFFIEFTEKVLKVDDPVGAISVHLGGGIMGTMFTGFFASNEFLQSRELTRAQFIGVQIIGIIAVGIFILALASAVLLILKKTVGLRVSRQDEEMGLDISEHGISSYADFQIKL